MFLLPAREESWELRLTWERQTRNQSNQHPRTYSPLKIVTPRNSTKNLQGGVTCTRTTGFQLEKLDLDDIKEMPKLKSAKQFSSKYTRPESTILMTKSFGTQAADTDLDGMRVFAMYLGNLFCTAQFRYSGVGVFLGSPVFSIERGFGNLAGVGISWME